MYIDLHVKYQLCLSNFKEPWIFSKHFQKKFTYQIPWKSIQWEPNCSTHTQGQTMSLFATLRTRIKRSCTWKSLSPGLVGAGLLDGPPWVPLPGLSVELWLIWCVIMASIRLAAVRVESPLPPPGFLPLPPPRVTPSRSRVPSPPAGQNDQMYYSVREIHW